MTTPPSCHGVLRHYVCDTCHQNFIVCRTDLLRPDIMMPGCWDTETCSACIDASILEHAGDQADDLIQAMRAHRNRMFDLNFKYAGACG